MQIRRLHSWDLDMRQAAELQTRLAPLVSRQDTVLNPRFVAGVDVSAPRGKRGAGVAAVSILSYPELEMVEVQTAHGEIGFPYVPGLLSFRELPLVARAFEKVVRAPDLVLVDGQGIAHPRRFGIAAHLGLLLDIPTIGCAKSRLVGEHAEPGPAAGSHAELTDAGEVIGAALRTQDAVRPVFVSIGHRVSLPQAITWVRACCTLYRLPEPARLAHAAAGNHRDTSNGLRTSPVSQASNLLTEMNANR